LAASSYFASGRFNLFTTGDIATPSDAISNAAAPREPQASSPDCDKIAEVNQIISRLDDKKNVFYMDIGQKFLDAKGVFLPESFRPDNLHPAAKGYDIWGEAVSATLAELMK
jgi:beta-glucosidase